MRQTDQEFIRRASAQIALAVLAAAIATAPPAASAAEPARDVYELDLPSIGASSDDVAVDREDTAFVATGARDADTGESVLGALTPGAAVAVVGALAGLGAAGIGRNLRRGRSDA